MPETTYLTTDTELTGVADAIRERGGTSESLEYPDGFVSASRSIPAGGGDEAYNIRVGKVSLWPIKIFINIIFYLRILITNLFRLMSGKTPLLINLLILQIGFIRFRFMYIPEKTP